MLLDGPSALSTIPEPARRERPFGPALVASALLHAGLVFALARVAMAPAPDGEAPAEAASVRVVVRSPPRRRPEAPPVETQPAVPSPAPAVEESPSTPPPAATASTNMPEAEPSAGVAPAIDRADEQDADVLTMQRVRESIATYLTGNKGTRLEEQLRECQQYRERYARWDCPRGAEPQTETLARIEARMEQTFRAWDYGYDLNIARSEKLMTQMLALRPLMEEAGVVGEAARAAQLVRVGEYERLNPHLRAGGNMLVAQPGSSGPSVGGSIAVLTIGLGGVTVLNGLVNIRWDGKVSGPTRVPARLPEDAREEEP